MKTYEIYSIWADAITPLVDRGGQPPTNPRGYTDRCMCARMCVHMCVCTRCGTSSSWRLRARSFDGCCCRGGYQDGGGSGGWMRRSNLDSVPGISFGRLLGGTMNSVNYYTEKNLIELIEINLLKLRLKMSKSEFFIEFIIILSWDEFLIWFFCRSFSIRITRNFSWVGLWRQEYRIENDSKEKNFCLKNCLVFFARASEKS